MGKKTKKWKPLTYTEDYAPAQKNATVEDEEVKQMLKSAHEVIEKSVAKLHSNLNLMDHPFFFIHVNAYVLVGTKAFYPCEIAVLKFSLLKGIEDTYHTLINPGSLPLGFAHDANSYSEVTHRVPYPPLKNAEFNFTKILNKVQQFVWGGPKAVEEQRRRCQFAEEDMCLPPMYTFYDKELFHYDFINEAVVFDLMQKLSVSSDIPCRFLLHPLTKLFYELRNTGADLSDADSKWIGIQEAQEALEEDSFLYTPMLGCEFHEKIDAPVCCSLSLVKRWALIVSTYFSSPSLELAAGRGNVVTAAQDSSSSMATAQANSSSTAENQHQAHSDPSWQVVRQRHKLPARVMPKLRQPYASIQDMKPIP